MEFPGLVLLAPIGLVNYSWIGPCWSQTLATSFSIPCFHHISKDFFPISLPLCLVPQSTAGFQVDSLEQQRAHR